MFRVYPMSPSRQSKWIAPILEESTIISSTPRSVHPALLSYRSKDQIKAIRLVTPGDSINESSSRVYETRLEDREYVVPRSTSINGKKFARFERKPSAFTFANSNAYDRFYAIKVKLLTSTEKVTTCSPELGLPRRPRQEIFRIYTMNLW